MRLDLCGASNKLPGLGQVTDSKISSLFYKIGTNVERTSKKLAQCLAHRPVCYSSGL